MNVNRAIDMFFCLIGSPDHCYAGSDEQNTKIKVF
jgi:hypothetical protein